MALTVETSRRVAALFSPTEVGEVERILATECGNNLSSCEHSSPEQLERLWFAALKLSKGNVAELKRAVALAKEDWRDLLMAAGFGYDTQAHRNWHPPPRR